MSSNKHIVALTERLASIEKLKSVSSPILSEKDSLLFEQNSIQVNKDLVCNGFNVQSMCAQNSVVKTNEHKQLVSANMSDFIFSDNIDIVNNPNGSISLHCNNSSSLPSSPTFAHINVLSDPVKDEHCVHKKYVDDKLEQICSGLIDVNTVQTRIVSTANSTGFESGSLIVGGGVSINKDVYVAGSLFLQNNTGFLTGLNYFEEGSLDISWSGIWDHELLSSFVYQRVGRFVSLMFPYISNRSVYSGVISNIPEKYLPKRLRPIYDISITIDGSDNDNSTIPVVVKIFGDNGKIIIKPKNNKSFSGSGIAGFNTFCIHYMTDT